MKSSSNGYSRNGYGAVTFSGTVQPKNLTNGKKLLTGAIKNGKLAAEYIETDRKGRGDCLNYDIYDVARGVVLVQRRHTTIDKYGNHPQKDYFIISEGGRVVEPVANKTMIVKWSRRAKKPGDIIKADRGEIKIDMSNPVAYGFKAVTKNEQGHYISVWDQSSWSLKKTRVEKATINHTGGFYYYPSVRSLKAAIEDNDVFGECRSHDNLFILKVRVEGHRYQVYNDKHCASRLTPVEVVKNA